MANELLLAMMLASAMYIDFQAESEEIHHGCNLDASLEGRRSQQHVDGLTAASV